MLPIKFTYMSSEYEQKVHVTIIGQLKHHFTGLTLYRVMEEGQTGWVDNGYFLEEKIQEWLRARVEE